jgi:hypothetical protein
MVSAIRFPVHPYVASNVPSVPLERVEGVEPSSLAWEARVMPLYDTRTCLDQATKFYLSLTSVKRQIAYSV